MITDLRIDEGRKKKYYELGYWTDKTLGDIWAEQAEKYPDREYVVDDQGTRLTYAELDHKAACLASWLAGEAGVKNGEIVSFQLPVWAEFCIIYVACLKVGAVMHPLARGFNGEDLVYIMNLVGSKAFICPTLFKNTDYEQQIIDVSDRIPSLQAIALIDKNAPSHSGLPVLSSIIEEQKPYTARPEAASDDVASILNTSGTTGRQKAVLLTHNNIIFSERAFVAALGRTQDDVMYMPSPLNHATGLAHGLISPLLLGGRTVLQQDFKVAEAVKLMNREGVTWTMGATPFVYDILNHIEAGGDKPAQLELYLCGGAPVPSCMVRRASSHGILLCEVYGSTESCPHIFVPPAKCLEWDGAWSGIPFEGIETRVVNDQGLDVACGMQGEELSRGPHMFVGYLNNREATDAALDADGWFYSGDLCIYDEQGRIRINGRKKEILIRGGENVSVVEVDEQLTGCPGIGDHATIGMPDERLGEKICTFAVPTSEHRPNIPEITGYLAGKSVPKRLWPERIEYIDAIPHTPTGKVQRYLLAKELTRRMMQARPS